MDRLSVGIFLSVAPESEKWWKKYGGRGKPIRGNLGEAGYQEIVDFQEFIGYSVCETTGTGIPTTWGKIHYAKDGAHIVPTGPRT